MDATSPTVPSQPRSQFVTWVVLAVAAGAVFIYSLAAPPRGDSGRTGPAIGKKLPFLQLEPLTGEATAVKLEDLQGRVTLINFWGTWCPPCRQEFPHIVELAQELAGNKSFHLYPVSCGQDGDEDLTDVRSETMAFLAARGAALSTYSDPNSESRRAMVVGLGLEGFGYPTTLVLDQQGVIRGFWIGYTPGTELEMKALVEELLAKPAA